MIELLSTFSIAQIIIGLFLVFVAVKEVISLIDFFSDKIKKHFNKEQKEIQQQEDIEDKFSLYKEELDKLEGNFNDLKSKIEILTVHCDEYFKKQDSILSQLTKSDRDDIKGWIVEKYHLHVEQREWIDDFTMDVLEKRYEHYKAEKGNSYIKSLMEELRALPKTPPEK